MSGPRGGGRFEEFLDDGWELVAFVSEEAIAEDGQEDVGGHGDAQAPHGGHEGLVEADSEVRHRRIGRAAELVEGPHHPQDGSQEAQQWRNGVDDGQLVVAIVNEENATLKRFYKEKSRARLQPANENFQPIYSKNCRVEAIVIGLVRKF